MIEKFHFGEEKHSAPFRLPKIAAVLMEPNLKSSSDHPNSHHHPSEVENKEDLPPMEAATITTNPPATEKRPRRRAREVSSRYMMTASSSSPISSSSSYGDPHLASSPRVACPSFPHPLLPLPKKHHHPQQKQQRRPPSIPSSPDATGSEPESSACFADENQPMGSVRRSLETPLLSGIQSKESGTQRKRAVVRLFDDNGGERQQPLEHPKPIDVKRRPRPGTPMVYPLDRTSSGTSITTPRSMYLSQNLQRSTSVGASAARRATPRPPTPARAGPFPSEKDSGNGRHETCSENSSAVANFSDSETCSVSSLGGLCDSPPLPGHSSCRARSVSDLRSSMPEADLLPTMSARRAAEGSSSRQDGGEDSSCRASNPLCYRSLNLALSSCQQNLNKSINRSLVPLKPPQPPSTKFALELRKGRKVSGRQEDVHMLRLLHNQYLQWRFVNAKAQATVHARRIAAERSLFGLSVKIAELQSSVTEKRTELEQLRRRESLLSILKAQMPYLDEWTDLEGGYSSSLSGATKALQDASLRLPIIGNVRADVRELKEVLESAMHIVESLSPYVGCFLPKAEGIEDIASDLARVVNSERALTEDCGNLLSEVHNLQVKEWSLRSQLMQLKRSNVV
ncbi:protein ENDOSPERM DEFECTIVE 1-like [Phoenix dactylifera]|uniref:Protein ENDOSPERM DEFECTIVE 1-like n=1 Tax=Phoenix dactylifera TaxID=42345 RepID=A0A8B7BQ73_PHODC|nr:protein ENDOSPERM DEFECTIVE 1-like [Phoenix dactylifera]